jgi:hypothetical protein
VYFFFTKKYYFFSLLKIKRRNDNDDDDDDNKARGRPAGCVPERVSSFDDERRDSVRAFFLFFFAFSFFRFSQKNKETDPPAIKKICARAE